MNDRDDGIRTCDLVPPDEKIDIEIYFFFKILLKVIFKTFYLKVVAYNLKLAQTDNKV